MGELLQFDYNLYAKEKMHLHVHFPSREGWKYIDLAPSLYGNIELLRVSDNSVKRRGI